MPRVIGSGFDTQGRETLSFIEGGLVYPNPWSARVVGHCDAGQWNIVV